LNEFGLQAEILINTGRLFTPSVLAGSGDHCIHEHEHTDRCPVSDQRSGKPGKRLSDRNEVRPIFRRLCHDVGVVVYPSSGQTVFQNLVRFPVKGNG
jgi:hypothetical protein